MDLSSILPLLMSKSGVGGDKMNTLMKFALWNKKSKPRKDLLP